MIDLKYKERKEQLFNVEFPQFVKDSKYPKTYSKVFAHALELQNGSELRAQEVRSKILSLEENYYIYALLDPRQPGPWIYILPGGKKLAFSHLPFYIGKGQDGRMHMHILEAKKNPRRIDGETKLNFIRELQQTKLTPIEVKLSILSIEAVAYAKEKMLIAIIGRVDLGTGPLTNISKGWSVGTGRRYTRRVVHSTLEAIVLESKFRPIFSHPLTCNTSYKLEKQLGEEIAQELHQQGEKFNEELHLYYPATKMYTAILICALYGISRGFVLIQDIASRVEWEEACRKYRHILNTKVLPGIPESPFERKIGLIYKVFMYLDLEDLWFRKLVGRRYWDLDANLRFYYEAGKQACVQAERIRKDLNLQDLDFKYVEEHGLLHLTKLLNSNKNLFRLKEYIKYT